MARGRMHASGGLGAVIRVPRRQGRQTGSRESYGEGFRRVEETGARLRNLHAEGCRSLRLISHSHFMRGLLNSLLLLPEVVFFQHQNCGLTHLTLGPMVSFEFSNLPLVFRSRDVRQR